MRGRVFTAEGTVTCLKNNRHISRCLRLFLGFSLGIIGFSTNTTSSTRFAVLDGPPFENKFPLWSCSVEENGACTPILNTFTCGPGRSKVKKKCILNGSNMVGHSYVSCFKEKSCPCPHSITKESACIFHDADSQCGNGTTVMVSCDGDQWSVQIGKACFVPCECDVKYFLEDISDCEIENNKTCGNKFKRVRKCINGLVTSVKQICGLVPCNCTSDYFSTCVTDPPERMCGKGLQVKRSCVNHEWDKYSLVECDTGVTCTCEEDSLQKGPCIIYDPSPNSACGRGQRSVSKCVSNRWAVVYSERCEDQPCDCYDGDEPTFSPCMSVEGHCGKGLQFKRTCRNAKIIKEQVFCNGPPCESEKAEANSLLHNRAPEVFSEAKKCFLFHPSDPCAKGVYLPSSRTCSGPCKDTTTCEEGESYVFVCKVPDNGNCGTGSRQVLKCENNKLVASSEKCTTLCTCSNKEHDEQFCLFPPSTFSASTSGQRLWRPCIGGEIGDLAIKKCDVANGFPRDKLKQLVNKAFNEFSMKFVHSEDQSSDLFSIMKDLSRATPKANAPPLSIGTSKSDVSQNGTFEVSPIPNSVPKRRSKRLSAASETFLQMNDSTSGSYQNEPNSTDIKTTSISLENLSTANLLLLEYAISISEQAKNQECIFASDSETCGTGIFIQVFSTVRGSFIGVKKCHTHCVCHPGETEMLKNCDVPDGRSCGSGKILKKVCTGMQWENREDDCDVPCETSRGRTAVIAAASVVLFIAISLLGFFGGANYLKRKKSFSHEMPEETGTHSDSDAVEELASDNDCERDLYKNSHEPTNSTSIHRSPTEVT